MIRCKALLVSGMLFGASLAAQKAGTAPQGNPQKGKQIFVKDGCYSCHGYDGHGGVAPKLAPRPMPMPAFIAIVRHPPPSGMPAYSAKVMPDADLADVWAYLRGIPEPPPVKSIPILNQ